MSKKDDWELDWWNDGSSSWLDKIELPAEDKQFRYGVVTFLDVLGWKGIWWNDYRNGGKDSTLERFVKLVKWAEEKCGKKLGTELLSISDTLVLLASCERDEAYEVLRRQAKLCKKILNSAAREGFGLRGAITVGEYNRSGNVVIGPAVDEVGSWHEQTEWLGVMLAPSAQLLIDGIEGIELTDVAGSAAQLVGDTDIVRYNDIPMKDKRKDIKYCLWWGKQGAALEGVLANVASLSPEIAAKYLNTRKYFDELKKVKKYLDGRE